MINKQGPTQFPPPPVEENDTSPDVWGRIEHVDDPLRITFVPRRQLPRGRRFTSESARMANVRRWFKHKESSHEQ